MNKLVIKSWNMDSEDTDRVQSYIEGICKGEVALAEPSATDLHWTLISLITAVSECYYAHRQEESAILGFACVACNHITANWQDYHLDPGYAVASMNEHHEGDTCIAVYLEI